METLAVIIVLAIVAGAIYLRVKSENRRTYREVRDTFVQEEPVVVEPEAPATPQKPKRTRKPKTDTAE